MEKSDQMKAGEETRAPDAAPEAAFDAVVSYSERLAHDANNYIGAILGLADVLHCFLFCCAMPAMRR